jgi:hypothetical protein
MGDIVIPTDADAIIGARTNPWDEPAIPNDPYVNVGDYPNAVRDFGAVGNGHTDDTDALTDALTDSDGLCVLPAGAYKVTDSLPCVDGGGFIGGGMNSILEGGNVPPVRIIGFGGFAIFEQTGEHAVNDFTLRGLGLIGSHSDSGSRGIYAESANNWTLRDLFCSGFANQGIWIRGGIGGTYRDIWVQESLKKRADQVTYAGAFQLGDATHYVTDAVLDYVSATAGFPLTPDGLLNGYNCGIYLGLIGGFATNCVGHMSEHGVYVPATGWYSILTGCRADLNQGHGFFIEGPANTFTGNLALRNSQDTDATYSGFFTTRGQGVFVGNRVAGIDGDDAQQRYGFVDVAADGTTNHFAQNHVGSLISGGTYHITNTSGIGPLDFGSQAKVYSGNYNPNEWAPAKVGSLFLHTGTGKLYCKTSGSGAAGWEIVTSTAP